MLGRHVGDRTMVLTDLHSLAGAVHRGGVPVLIQDLGQLASHVFNRLALFYQRPNICHEALKADFGKVFDGLGPADRA